MTNALCTLIPRASVPPKVSNSQSLPEDIAGIKNVPHLVTGKPKQITGYQDVDFRTQFGTNMNVLRRFTNLHCPA